MQSGHNWGHGRPGTRKQMPVKCSTALVEECWDGLSEYHENMMGIQTVQLSVHGQVYYDPAQRNHTFPSTPSWRCHQNIVYAEWSWWFLRSKKKSYFFQGNCCFAEKWDVNTNEVWKKVEAQRPQCKTALQTKAEGGGDVLIRWKNWQRKWLNSLCRQTKDNCAAFTHTVQKVSFKQDKCAWEVKLYKKLTPVINFFLFFIIYVTKCYEVYADREKQL